MKKVGLVSVRNYNYGSILQAYALQQELFAAGIDNELIYYKKRNVVKQALRIFNLPLLMAKTKDVWRVIEGKTNPKLKPIISGRNRAFSNFLKDNFVFTPCLSGRKQLVDYTKKFDAFILGSDQVWNPMLAQVFSVVFNDKVVNAFQYFKNQVRWYGKKRKFRRVGNNVHLEFPAKILTPDKIEIGDNVFIAENAILEVWGDNPDACISIGNNVCISL